MRSSREDVEDWKVLEGGGDEENEGEGSFADSAAHSMLLFGGQRRKVTDLDQNNVDFNLARF